MRYTLSKLQLNTGFRVHYRLRDYSEKIRYVIRDNIWKHDKECTVINSNNFEFTKNASLIKKSNIVKKGRGLRRPRLRY